MFKCYLVVSLNNNTMDWIQLTFELQIHFPFIFTKQLSSFG
uniref:Uncharacterized protein n=2 Tax=Anguilla anguilla TaxID=7936 RepID=A0A0E9TCL8_ANGAN